MRMIIACLVAATLATSASAVAQPERESSLADMGPMGGPDPQAPGAQPRIEYITTPADLALANELILTACSRSSSCKLLIRFPNDLVVEFVGRDTLTDAAFQQFKQKLRRQLPELGNLRIMSPDHPQWEVATARLAAQRAAVRRSRARRPSQPGFLTSLDP